MLRAQAEQDGLPLNRIGTQASIVVGIEGTGQFALRDRMILAVLHVLFAHHNSLIGVPHCLAMATACRT
jgi:hypothetical protein